MAQYHTRTFAIVKRDVFLPNTSCIVFLKKIQRRVSTPFALGHPIEARSILLAGDTKGDGVPFGRKNPKKPAVSWQGIQRGQCPLGTRLCSQSLVCYTFAKGMASGRLVLPPGRRHKKMDADWNCGAIAVAGSSLLHPRNKGIPSPLAVSPLCRIPSSFSGTGRYHN
mgnify:FL=1